MHPAPGLETRKRLGSGLLSTRLLVRGTWNMKDWQAHAETGKPAKPGQAVRAFPYEKGKPAQALPTYQSVLSLWGIDRL